MKLGIMQPYFFPYLGYFQLINAVDKFVVYDDVNYIKGGWINRNYILANGNKQLITLQLKGASSFTQISRVRVGGNRGKLVKTISQAYCKAPFYKEVFPLIEECLNYEEENLAEYISYSLKCLAAYMEIKTEFIMSSNVDKDNSLMGQDKVLAICEALEADEYYNAIGGLELYSQKEFANRGLALKFVRPREVKYDQFASEFVPNLSIIDVLMFNLKDQVKVMLNQYEIL